MAKAGVVVEQLFEDFPQNRNVYDRYSMESPTLSSVSEKHGKQTKGNRSRRKSTVDSINSPVTSHASHAANTTTPQRHSRTSVVPSITISSMSSKSKSKDPSAASLGGSPIKFPITYDVALALFNNKLSPMERIEIQNFERIYFMGIDSNKIQVAKNGSLDLYDDEEGFYKAIPHDHIAYRYETVDKPTLGKGTFAQVVKAYDHKEKRKVAIKIVRNERIYLKQSREELRILQVLRKQDAAGTHNMVQFYEFFMFRNHMCITFELLGMNLYQVLKRNQYKGLGSGKIMLIARGTLKCLELLYRSRIIHCDIKPENIMLKRNGDFTSVKVGDFGSSCYEQQQIYHYVQSRFYRAPEVMLGLRYGPAIDMWSLGCVLGELSSGYPIFMGRDENDQLSAIEEVMGEIPRVMMAKTKLKVKATSGRGSPASKDFSSIVIGDEQFRNFVRQMLEWDHHIRPSPAEMQEHPWIKSRVASAQPKVGSSKSHPGAVGQTRLHSGKASLRHL